MIREPDHRAKVVPVVTDGEHVPAPVGAPESDPGGSVAALGDGQATPPGGRRRRKEGGRGRRLNLRLPDDEHQQLEAMATEAGVSVSRLVIEKALGEGVNPARRRALVASFLAARRQVVGASTNLNQLAKWSNTNEAYPPGADRAADALAEATEQLAAVLDRIER